jgi:hypothetical protein
LWNLLLFLDPGSEVLDLGWVKIWTWDKHPGSTTLILTIQINCSMYPGPDPGVPNRSKYEKTKKILEGEASPRDQKSEVLKNKYYNLFTWFVPNPS